MSMFLPDGAQGTVPPSGVTDFSPATDEVTSSDIAIMQRVLSAAAQNPSMIPESFMAYVLDWLQVNNLQIPIGQVFGFQKFLSTQVTVDFISDNGVGTTTSATYGDLTGATAGPELDGLPDGKYLILFGAAAGSGVTATETALVSILVNGVAATDNDAAQNQNAALASIVRGVPKSLSNNGSSSVKLVYREAGGGSGTFSFRWLAAIRYDNL